MPWLPFFFITKALYLKIRNVNEKKKMMRTRLLGKMFNFLFSAHFDKSDTLRSSCSEDEQEEDLDSVLM